MGQEPQDKLANKTGLRADQFLFFCRFAKSRALAATMINDGCLRLERAGLGVQVIEKPSSLIKSGDVISIIMGPTAKAIKVLSLPNRRGPAKEAQIHYALLA